MTAEEQPTISSIRLAWDDARGEGFMEMQNCAFEYFPAILAEIERLEKERDMKPLTLAEQRAEAAAIITDLEAQVARLTTERTDAVKILSDLVNQLQAVWFTAHNHGVYKGPSYEGELKAAHAFLAGLSDPSSQRERE